MSIKICTTLKTKALFFCGGFAGGNGGDISAFYKVIDKDGDSITVTKITYDDSSKVKIDDTQNLPSLSAILIQNFLLVIDGEEISRTYTGGNSYEGKYFKLANDIDFTNKTFTQIGDQINYFKGTFDGDNKTISGITEDLFYYNYGTIEGCVSTATLNANNQRSGIASINDGHIKNCINATAKQLFYRKRAVKATCFSCGDETA